MIRRIVDCKFATSISQAIQKPDMTVWQHESVEDVNGVKIYWYGARVGKAALISENDDMAAIEDTAGVIKELEQAAVD